IGGSTEDSDRFDSIFSQLPICAVMHFASSIQVGESVIRPDLYYVNNLSNTIILLNAMMRANVKHLIFSSTAAVYGDPHYTPIDEGHPKLPLNPYGRTKWMAEQVLQDFDRAFGLRYTSLRYFNAAGANISASLGERHEPETHLI
ncbi:NAD-dependent epimerase/dehydratase family protein, partial [Pediococcus acidilactici]|uniref:NAD-dependent epimerase/dehydratase family protein n=1 Tax=Pediococcus acidilactici TaxID=1254 RepID=UPI00300CBB3E